MAKGRFEKGRTGGARASAATKAVARSGKKGKKRTALIWTSSLAAVALLCAAVLLWGAVLQQGKKIYPNVCVAGVEVGGLTVSAAIG